MKPFSRLFKTIVEAESIFNDKSLTWEHKYSVLFNKHKMKISPLIRKIGIDFIWIDPDTSYEEDVAAYMLSLMVLKGQIAEQAEKQERDTKALLNGQQDQAWEELRSIFYDDFNHDEREEISRMILDGDIKSFSDEMLDTIRALAKVALGEVILRGKRNRPQTDDIY